MSVKKLDRISWSRSGRPVASSDRKIMLAVLRRAKREGRVQERDLEGLDIATKPPRPKEDRKGSRAPP